ncbi:hypothetical protein MSPP1_000463 [Malassezia sp. CBS 17886]|nr:hypothetical protein MSPP1_000463 [Malassezia sp. CBS 17886]
MGSAGGAKSPAAVPHGALVDADRYTYTIYDGYPKAQYHFLILHLDSIRTLLENPYADEVLSRLQAASDRLVARIEGCMRELHVERDAEPSYAADGAGACRTTWGIQRGFHAVPSMRHLHLHVLSTDLVSERLKHKKHYLAFHPTAGYWLPLADARALAASSQQPCAVLIGSCRTLRRNTRPC